MLSFIDVIVHFITVYEGIQCLAGSHYNYTEPRYTTKVATRMAAKGYVGRLGEFKSENKSIMAYLDPVDLYFQDNGIAEEAKVATFLTIIGGKTYTLLRSLTAPALPKEKSLAQLKETLKRHLCRLRSPILVSFFHTHCTSLQ